MKEFYGTTGGRTAFNEDFLALRDLALSFHHIFDDCGENFIISGCKLNVTSEFGNNVIVVSDGYVWLSGKVRSVKRTKIINASSVYIIANNHTGQMINYATKGVFGEMSFDYETSIVTEQPSGNEYIKVGTNKWDRNIRNILFNKYVATKSAYGQQTINDDVNFKNGLSSSSIRFQNGEKYVTAEVSVNGEFIMSVYSHNALARKYIISDRIICVGSDGNDEMQFPQKDGFDKDVCFKDLECNSANYDLVDGSTNIYLNDVHFDDIFYRKKPYVDWTSLLWTNNYGKNDEEIPSLKLKNIGNETLIAGILPTNDSKFTTEVVKYDENTKYADFKTNIKIPFLLRVSNTELSNTILLGNVVRGENITIKNTCTIWYIKDGFLHYKAYLESESNGGNGVGLPCPASVFWDFVY